MSTPAYQALILNQRPLAYWRNKATSADLASQIPIFTTGGAPANGTSLIQGDADPSISFTAANNDAIGMALTGTLTTPAVSVSCWIRPQSVPAAGVVLVALDSAAVEQWIIYTATNFVHWRFANSAGDIASPAAAVQVGSPLHIVGTYSTGAAQLFVNGVLVGSSALGGALSGLTRQILFANAYGLPFDGLLDEPVVWSRVLTPGEILAQFKAGAANYAPNFDPTLSPPLRVVSLDPETNVSYDLTGLVEGLSYSNVNPGGDEQASFTYKQPWTTNLPELTRGFLLRISAGLDELWKGRIEEADRGVGDVEQVSVVAYGLGNRLKDSTMREIYVDRDLSRWQTPSNQRRVNLGTAIGQVDGEVVTDTSTGAPAVELKLTSPWSLTSNISELWYDAGVGLAAASVWYDIALLGFLSSDASLTLSLISATDDVLGNQISSANLRAATTGYFSPSTPQRWIDAQLLYAAAHAGDSGVDYPIFLRRPAVYGNHGLALQGSDPGGLTPDQIIDNVIGRATGITRRRLDSQSFVIPHFIVTDPTTYEDVVAAAAAFTPVDWGTWGVNSPLDSSLNGYFDLATEDRATQHWFAPRAAFDEVSLHSEMANLYNRAEVSYTDAAGATFVEVRTASVPELDRLGITRTIEISGGTLTQAAAQALADTYLALYGGFAPARGSVSISGPITHYRRGKLSPVYLRADGSNLRIPDILPTQTLFALDSTPDRRTTFPIKRVTVDCSGDVPKATLDLDQASDSLAALEAQIAVSASYNNFSALLPAGKKPETGALTPARQRALEMAAGQGNSAAIDALAAAGVSYSI